jgi:hypothetical protein
MALPSDSMNPSSQETCAFVPYMTSSVLILVCGDSVH